MWLNPRENLQGKKILSAKIEKQVNKSALHISVDKKKIFRQNMQNTEHVN